MVEARLVLAQGADIVVRANAAPEPLARLNLPAANVASGGKRRGGWVVQVVQHHHRRVLRPPEGVKLVVVALAESEESLPRLENVALHGGVCVARVLQAGHRGRLLEPMQGGRAAARVLRLVVHAGRLDISVAGTGASTPAVALEVACATQVHVRAVPASEPPLGCHNVLAAVAADRLEVHHDEVVLHMFDLITEPRHDLRLHRLVRRDPLAAAPQAPAFLGRRLLPPPRPLEGLLLGALLLRKVLGGLSLLFPFVADLLQVLLERPRNVVALEVRQVSRVAAALAPVVFLPPLEKEVPEIRRLFDDPLPLCPLQHPKVPLPKPVALGRLLPLRVHVEDVVLTRERRAGPNVHAGEAPILEVLKIAHDKLLIHQSPQAVAVWILARFRFLRRAPAGPGEGRDVVWLEVSHAVQVAEVGAACVGLTAVLAVLLHMHAEEAQVDALHFLKEQEGLGPVLER
mmetsp:Transcript_28821/g.60709  ORF Transcript_28821/g.60709 Transcript_28821/m.60709 type:complete len:459 (-) Transcript_28821:192-1568(-)